MKYKVNVKLGKKIRKFREEKDLTQDELAEKVGLHPTTIARIERGESNSPVFTVYKIAEALRRSMKDLFD